MTTISRIDTWITGSDCNYPGSATRVKTMRDYFKACDEARRMAAETGLDYLVQPAAYKYARLTACDTIIRANAQQRANDSKHDGGENG